MIPKESFLRNVPSVLHLKQRLVFERAACAIGSIGWSFERLKEAAINIANNSDDLAFAEQQGVFVNCWSIIDQCHMLRTLLKSLPPRAGGEIAIFVEKYENATFLRNQMDHLPQLLKNLAAQKEARAPIFGVLSFATASADDVEVGPDGAPTLKRCRTITLTAGSLTHQNHLFNFPNPAGHAIELPVGLFMFEGPTHVLNFSNLLVDLRSLIAHFDTSVREKVQKGVREAAEKHGLDAEKLLAQHSGGMKFEIHMSFVDTA